MLFSEDQLFAIEFTAFYSVQVYAEEEVFLHRCY